MGRIIYAFKIALLRDSFPMSEEDRKQIISLCRFFLHLYAVPWFKADYATEAAFQDLQFLKRAHQYKKLILTLLDNLVIASPLLDVNLDKT